MDRHSVGWLGFRRKADMVSIKCIFFHENFHIRKKGKSPVSDQVVIKSLKTDLEAELRSETSTKPPVRCAFGSPIKLYSFLLPSLAAFFPVHYGCIPKSTIKFPLCLCGRWQMHGGHLVLPRQAGHLLWLMLGCGKKKWAGKELQWRAHRLEGDILISPALSSLLAFGYETPSGGRYRGYWCKTAWNVLCQVAVYSCC